jgi:hypothetical protein
MTLFVELGRIEMGSWRVWLREKLKGLNAQARGMAARIAANVAGILEGTE